MGRWQSGMVVGLLLAGCSTFVAADNPDPAPMGSGTTASEGSTSTGGVTGSAEGSGGVSTGGSVDGSATTDPAPTDTSGSDSMTGDALDGSTGSTGAEAFPFEAAYSGSFSMRCGGISGTLSLAVDGTGLISGTAMASGQTAAVAGSVDALGSVVGSATIPGAGACSLTGDIAPVSLLGNGSVSCPSAPCSGTWVLAGI